MISYLKYYNLFAVQCFPIKNSFKGVEIYVCESIRQKSYFCLE